MSQALQDRETTQHATLSETDFHSLLLASLPALRQQALALTRRRADADDLVQNAVSNALAARASFEAGTNFKGWMYRILRNRFFSDIRRRRETVPMEDAPADAFARSGNQEDNLAIGELRRNLARLPADHRVALLAITVQGLSYEEASEQFGVAVGTLKCRVFRARKQLQAWLLGEPEAIATNSSRKTKTAGFSAPSSSIHERRGDVSRLV